MLFLAQDMHLVKGIFTGCAGMGFYSGRVKQIADFSQCRLLLDKDGSLSELPDALLQEVQNRKSDY
jgi:hypothetical protein